VPKLAIRRGDTFDREVDLSALKEKPLKLGRGEQNDIVLPDPTKAVSRFHAELRREGAKYILEDRDSQNGLWVAGRRQPRVILEPGVPVTVGSYTVMVVAGANEPAASATGDLDLPTMVGPRKAPQVAVPPAKPGAPAAAAPAGAKPAAPGGGMRKTLVFGGFAAIVILAAALMQVFRSTDPSIRESGTRGSTAEPQPPNPTAATPPPAAGGQQPTDQRPATAPPSAEPAPTTSTTTPASATASTASPTGVPAQAAGSAPAAASAAPPQPNASAPDTRTAAARTASQADANPRSTARPEKAAPAQPTRTPANPREREFSDRYDRAKVALGREAYAEAIPILNDLQRDQPGYRDVPMLLMQAANGVKTQAQGALAEAARLEQADDQLAALAQYQRAQQIDPSMSGVVEPSVKRVRDRMRVEGISALKDARQYDAFGQSAKAIPLYEKAYRYLPEEDAERKAAKDRLDALRAKK
jgi:FHA domain-containing protein